jgi:phosphate transport system substrate-binding protein
VNGRSDVGMISATLTPDERKEYETAGKTFHEFLVALDAVVVIVSKPVYDAGVTNLTLGQIRQIYTDKIANWRAIGGPDHRIFIYSREPGSGTRNAFDRFILGSNETERWTTGIASSNLEFLPSQLASPVDSRCHKHDRPTNHQ